MPAQGRQAHLLPRSARRLHLGSGQPRPRNGNSRAGAAARPAPPPAGAPGPRLQFRHRPGPTPRPAGPFPAPPALSRALAGPLFSTRYRGPFPGPRSPTPAAPVTERLQGRGPVAEPRGPWAGPHPRRHAWAGLRAGPRILLLFIYPNSNPEAPGFSAGCLGKCDELGHRLRITSQHLEGDAVCSRVCHLLVSVVHSLQWDMEFSMF